MGTVHISNSRTTKADGLQCTRKPKIPCSGPDYSAYIYHRFSFALKLRPHHHQLWIEVPQAACTNALFFITENRFKPSLEKA
jgi:hypothetical protein